MDKYSFFSKYAINSFKVVVKRKVTIYYFLFRIIFFVFFCQGCVDPVAPEYSYKEGLVYVDAFVSTNPKASYVKISRSFLQRSDRLVNEFVSGASVFFINTDVNISVELTEQDGVYLPPDNFSANVGDSWKLEIKLNDGTEYQSLEEVILEPVAISDIKSTYNPELLYSPSSEIFLPGHSISVTFNDPPNKENYYYWRFRSFEKIITCEICYENDFFRGGECTNEDGIRPTIRGLYFTYNCETDCWRIRQNTSVEIFSDEFVDGNTVSDLPVANTLLYTKENILVELQQYSLTSSAHKYYQTLKDIVDNNGGFNSPPPAALIGNMFNPNDKNEFVLGRFTSASSSKASIFIRRDLITEPEIEEGIFRRYEREPYIKEPDTIVTEAPCVESIIRTGIRPEGWID